MTELIVEIGINHLGDLKKAKNLIDLCYKAGLNLIKLQYRGKTFSFTNSLEMGSTLLSDEIDCVNLDIKTTIKLCKYARNKNLQIGVSFFRTEDLVDFCARFKPDFIKIPSAESQNYSLIRIAQKHSKIVIVSTGGATESDLLNLNRSIKFRKKDCVMYCVANYPTTINSIRLDYLKQYRNIFSCRIGYSSHDEHWEVCIAAFVLGADYIERHLCESKNDIGLDISTSSEIGEFIKLNKFLLSENLISKTLLSLKTINQGEIQNIKDLGSGYYFKNDEKSGAKLIESDFIIKSPCRGIKAGSIKFPITLVGNSISGSPLTADFLENEKSKAKPKIELLNFNKISLPVRFFDYLEIDKKFNLHNYEFHMSYNDVDNWKLNIDRIGALCDLSSKIFSIHLPDYISPNNLMDPISRKQKNRLRSIQLVEETCLFANYLYDLTGKRVPIVGSFSVLNGRKADWYRKLSQFVNSKCNNKFFIVPQFLPVKAWYFGGSCTIDVFCDLEDIEYYSYFSNGLCIDYAHLSMACESRKGSLANWIKKLSKLAGHIHLSDSIGEDGEGVLFGKGNISPFIKKIVSTEVPKVIEQWEGHLNNFSGFNDALLYIEEYC